MTTAWRTTKNNEKHPTAVIAAGAASDADCGSVGDWATLRGCLESWDGEKDFTVALLPDFNSASIDKEISIRGAGKPDSNGKLLINGRHASLTMPTSAAPKGGGLARFFVFNDGVDASVQDLNLIGCLGCRGAGSRRAKSMQDYEKSTAGRLPAKQGASFCEDSGVAHGGAICSEGAHLSLLNVGIAFDSRTYVTAIIGGALAAQRSTVSLSEVNISGAITYGAAGAFFDSCPSVDITGANFSNNEALERNPGGHLGILNSNVTVSDSVMFRGAGDGGGGAADISASTVEFNRVVFDGNMAWGDSWGGAIMMEGSTVKAYDCRFVDNWAPHFGGAVSSIDFGQFTAERTTFEGNFADNMGGALFFSGNESSTVLMTDISFMDNSVKGLPNGNGTDTGGGAMFFDLDGEVKCVRCTCKGNEAMSKSSGGMVPDDISGYHSAHASWEHLKCPPPPPVS